MGKNAAASSNDSSYSPERYRYFHRVPNNCYIIYIYMNRLCCNVRLISMVKRNDRFSWNAFVPYSFRSIFDEDIKSSVDARVLKRLFRRCWTATNEKWLNFECAAVSTLDRSTGYICVGGIEMKTPRLQAAFSSRSSFIRLRIYGRRGLYLSSALTIQGGKTG